ncbi:peptidyl-tRNA hydrolase [Corynebacterium alimapuense]|uniref:peptidyl-tRNA hydrolase n=1 Tax=Corynebacterium alimapuense TaxID=1576874 RepID=A0A3M8KAH1_9CORY|nr:peptidyl-tRNA hydrolase [Corynebacterium alimapuense]RNE49795.1 hypothetical protein C5L39_05055 [Corynebacterium alimapuense]
MQIVLEIPKAQPPVRSDLLAAAARSVVAVCFDERAATDPIWRESLSAWYDHLIRKVVRRARNQAWLKVQDLPGVTVNQQGAQARAFIPSPVSEVNALVGKLQISGTELPRDLPDALDPQRPVIFIDAGLKMSTGKAAAQVGHASMLLAAAQPLEWVRDWAASGFELSVRELESASFASRIKDPRAVLVRDAGYTEVAPDSLTVCALPEP